MLPLFCILFLAIGQSLAINQANEYIETVLETAFQDVIRNEKLDPADLPDYIHKYNWVTFRPYHTVQITAEYTEGALYGLSRITRYAECIGPVNGTESAYINCILKFNQLVASYKGNVGSIEFQKIPKVDIDAEAAIEQTVVDVTIARSLSGGNPQIEKFYIRQDGRMRTYISDLGPRNKYKSNVENEYAKRLKADVKSIILNKFQSALNQAVSQVPMPVD